MSLKLLLENHFRDTGVELLIFENEEKLVLLIDLVLKQNPSNDLGREYYAKAINNNFDHLQPYVNLGRINEEIGNNEETIKNYNKAISRDKFRADAKFRKAHIYMNEKNILKLFKC
jgi:tetratricopeptide (TPR) repeat protein